MYAEEELDAVNAETVDDTSPQLNQQVVFYRDSTYSDMIRFSALFNDVGNIEIRVLNQDNEVVTKAEHTLTADTEFSDMIDFIGTRIEALDDEAEDPVWPTSVQGNHDDDLAFYDDGGGVITAAATGSPPDGGTFGILSGPPTFAGSLRTHTAKVLIQLIAIDVTQRAVQYAFSRGIIDGMWGGLKSDYQAVVDLSAFAGEASVGDFTRAKAMWDSIKMLVKLTPAERTQLINAIFSAVVEQSEQSLGWTYSPGNPSSNLVLASYVEGYLVGFITEQVLITMVGVGILTKVGLAYKSIITAARAGTLATMLTAKVAQVQKFIVATYAYVSQYVETVQMARNMRIIIQQGAERLHDGQKAAELIQSALVRFDDYLGYWKSIIEKQAALAKQYLPFLSYERIVASSLDRLARLISLIGPGDITQDAITGFKRFFPVLIKNEAGDDYFDEIVEFCTDTGNVLNKQDLNDIFEMFSDTGTGFRMTQDATDPTVWVSPNGVRYIRKTNPANPEHRITHILHHCADDAARAAATPPVPHGVFTGGRKEVFELLDDVWANSMQLQLDGKMVIAPNFNPSATIKNYNVEFDFDIGRANNLPGSSNVNPSGYTPTRYMRLAIKDDGEIVTAFPIIP